MPFGKVVHGGSVRDQSAVFRGWYVLKCSPRVLFKQGHFSHVEMPSSLGGDHRCFCSTGTASPRNFYGVSEIEMKRLSAIGLHFQ